MTATRTAPTPDATIRRSTRKGRREARVGLGFLLPFAAMFVVVFVVPIIVSIRESFFAQKPVGGGLFGGGELVDTFVGFDNFIAAAGNPAFWAGMGRVLAFAVIQIPIMIGLALLLALLLDSYLIRRVAFFRLAFFLPYAVPGVIAAMMWVYLYTPELSPFMPLLPEGTDLMSPSTLLFSMANMTTWTFTGYNMLIFLAALQAVPRDIYEAARIDGASGWQIATQIKIPLLSGAALLAVLLSIIGTIQLFNEPVILQKVNPWMGFDYTPMMLTYNTLVGTVSPSGNGPASALSLLMAVIAGLLAAGYTLISNRKAGK